MTTEYRERTSIELGLDTSIPALGRLKDRPLVSIGLPVFNGENYLEQAICSILEQSYFDLELIICDNASTDRTGEIAKRFQVEDRRVRYYLADKNLGAAANFNRVFELAQGEYFKWAAHDDLCRNDFLQRCVEVLQGDPGVVLCHSEIEWVDEKGDFLRDYNPDLRLVSSPCSHVRFKNLITGDHYCFDVFGLIRRSALAKTSLIGSYIGSDRVLLAQLGLYGRFYRVPEVLFLSRDHSERSIRSMRIRERGEWFDPSLEGKIPMVYWRLFFEYLNSIIRSSVKKREKVWCFQAVFAWFIKNATPLRRELTGTLKRAGRRQIS